MFKGFRDFILRGNVVDLAVAVIIGTAFGAITTSLVKDILTPLIAAIVGKPDFSALVLTVGSGKLTYGNFLNALVNFLLQAAAVYFFVVLPVQKLLARLNPETPAEVTTKACPQCLGEIPLAATRCKFCTQPV
jgi:large conductance mechanosensitive channel